MTAAGFDVPVVFLVFNRPEQTARVFACIRAVRPSRLFVVADGPRTARPGEAEKCRQVRGLIEEGVDWPCEVVRDYAETNLGCAQRVSSGITNAFRQVEQVVILEDDCLPDPTFFLFCAELLERYRHDERVAQIAGCSFRTPRPPGSESYYFSRYPHCWGWATWRRAWRHYDHSMTLWNDAAKRKAVLDGFESSAERRYWKHAFSGTLSGRHDTWDYRWTLACMGRGALSVVASTNLVTNIGYGGAATHTAEVTPLANLSLQPAEFPLVHPTTVTRDRGVDVEVGKRCFRRPSLLARVLRRLRRNFA